MKPSRLLLVSFLLAFSAACVAQAQPPEPQTSQSLPTITKETSLVLVDTVVTDKKGNYIRDLTAKDFKVWEDNREQPVRTFSSETEASAAADRKRYLVLFFDNSTMNVSDQAKARDAALKFLDTNTGANRYIAVVDFGGSLRIAQNFTSDAERLKQVVRTLKFSAVAPNTETAASQPVPAPVAGIPQLVSAEANFGVRTLLLALRNLARGMASVPGRKSLVLFSSGFPMNPTDPDMPQRESELTAAIDACNKANVAIYPIDVRGLITPLGFAPEPQLGDPQQGQLLASMGWSSVPDSAPRLVPAVLQLEAGEEPAHLLYVQRGGSGGGGGHGGGTGGGHGTGGAGTGTGGRTGSAAGRTGGGAAPGNPLPVAPYSQSRQILPTVTDITGNQQVLYELAVGTGGFVIVNSNDLLGGLQKIAQEQTQYYVLGYAPPASEEGSCHTLRVKVDRSGTVVRSRSGYCNVRPADLLAGKPVEKQLENQASGSQPGNVAASMLAPWFYISPNTARVNLAIEIPSSAIHFEKQKGKEHAEINLLGLAYGQGGAVAARFSDKVEFNFEDKDQLKEFAKKPYQYENQFEIAAGHYTLKVAFTSGGTSVGKLEMPLAVDSYDARQFSMSAVALSKELHPLSQMAASLDAALLEDRTPLVAQGVQIVPAGDDHFKKSDLAVFYAEIYDPLLSGENPPKVGVQMVVLDRKTREKKLETGGPVPEAKPGSPVVPVGLKLPVDKLPPGSYELEVRAGDSTGRFTPVRTANFEVE
ncbi:MAG TPA: VWA domain-containing protein [Candidatus Binatia bacterium]|nr:VWA domain-containing protein [Candidatus Binatia bacterium]